MHKHGRVGRRDYDLETVNTELKSLVIFHSSDRLSRAWKHHTTVSSQQLAFNHSLFLFTSHFYVHLPGHPSSRSPAFCVTSTLLHTSVWKGHASSNWRYALSQENMCTCLFVFTPVGTWRRLFSHPSRTLLSGIFALLLKCYMLLINTATKCQVKGQAVGARCSRERALWSLSCFTLRSH